MKIENLVAFKSWLTTHLEPLCEADPTALANYVVALVKKDRPENHLRVICRDQLEVFLQQGTATFVEVLFSNLKSKEYILNADVEPPKDENGYTVKEEIALPEADVENNRKKSQPINRSSSKLQAEQIHGEHKRRDDAGFHRERVRHKRSHRMSRSRSWSSNRSKEHKGCRDSQSEEDRKNTDIARLSPHNSNSLPPLAFSSGISQSPIATLNIQPNGNEDTQSCYAGSQPENGLPITNGVNNNRSPVKRWRCRDFDEKGFCVHGDLCPFDHGTDPLVVKDVSLPNMIHFPPQPVMSSSDLFKNSVSTMTSPVTYVPATPPSLFALTGPSNKTTSEIQSPSHQPPVISVPPNGALDVRKPPTLVLQPDATSTPVSQRPQFTQTEYNLDQEAYNPESPALTPSSSHNSYGEYVPRVWNQRPNLIGLTSANEERPGGETDFHGEQNGRKRAMESSDGPLAKKTWGNDSDYNNRHRHPRNTPFLNTKLEVRKIPWGMNNITLLNGHFSKFGNIVNIQVSFGGDPETALIQYTNNAEAKRAISSTEAILNNRFIRVHWHQEPPSVCPHHEHNEGCMFPDESVDANAVSEEQNLSSDVSRPTSPTDSQIVRRDSMSPPPVPFDLEGLPRHIIELHEYWWRRQCTLKLQHSLRKKQQKILHCQIECQKALIRCLERKKKMKPEERTRIMDTIKDLTGKTAQLQNQMAYEVMLASEKLNLDLHKSKEETQKELLDTELEMLKLQTAGEDTGELKKRLLELQLEATELGLIKLHTESGHSGVAHTSQARNHNWDADRGFVSRMVVDRRPRAVVVHGVAEEEIEELLQHFASFADLDDYMEDNDCVVLSFTTRTEAEIAARRAAFFKGRNLQMTWYKPMIQPVVTETEEEESKDEDSSRPAESQGEPVSTKSLSAPRVNQHSSKEKNSTVVSTSKPERENNPALESDDEEEEEEDDDEEEEENESRSWRR